MRTALSAAGPLPTHLAMRPAALPQEARGATHQLLTVVRPTGTESGRQEGLKQLHVEAIAVTPRCHRAGEADVVEAEAELHVKLHVKREARAVGGKPGCRAWLTSSATTAPPVPEVDCWLDALPSLNVHGFASRGKQSPLKAGSSHSNGWRRLPRLVWRQMTDAGWTSSSMARPGVERLLAVT